MLAEKILNLMGYKTSLILGGSMPILYVRTPGAAYWQAGASIAWPCSGVESLIIYTVVIVLFLRTTIPSWKQKIIYFTIGAIITYLINILRIVTIFVIAVNTGGVGSPEAQSFHNYYGQLYSIVWIVSYPLIIIGSRTLWTKIRNKKPIVAENQGLPNQDKPSQNIPSTS
jgi:exosortase/archaeosortase family protein